MRRRSSHHRSTHRRSHARVSGLVSVVFMLGSLLVAPTLAAAENPHGDNSEITRKCQTCHRPHGAEGEIFLFPHGGSVTEFCYTCHDGTGSVFNTRMDFDRFPSAVSSHPVEVGTLGCADCHTPHQGPAEDNPRSLAAGASNESTGNAVCGACHGTASTLPGGDLLARYTGTAHDTSVSAPASGTGIKCLACHVAHSSNNIALARAMVVGASGATRTVEATAGTGTRPLCEACHDVAQDLWRGPVEYGKTSHAVVTTSTRAAVMPTLSAESTITTGTWPPPGDCDNCHEPHGTGLAYLTRATGDALCYSCHDAPEATQPSTYSYQGRSDYGISPHGTLQQDRAGATQARGCNVCHAVHGGGTRSVDATSPAGLLWRYEGDLCTGSGTGGCHADPANATGGTDILAALEASTSPNTRHDILPADQNATGARLQCSGCHNPHADTAAAVYSDPDSIGTTMPVGFAEYVGPAGEVYALVGAEHDGVAPVITPPQSLVATSIAGTMTVQWSTDESSTSWVDWGTTPVFELGSSGTTLPLTTQHSVELTPVVAGDYHFRVRSADALGNQVISPAYVLNPDVTISGAPVQTPLGVVFAGVNGTSVTTTWSAVTISDGHSPQYFVELRNLSGTVVHRSGWIGATSWTSPRLNFGTYRWQVWARDPNHINAWSVSGIDTFNVEFSGGLEIQRWFASLWDALAGLAGTQPSHRAPQEPSFQVAVVGPVTDTRYSVDTDFIAVETRSRNAPTATYGPVAGWETSSSAVAPPTPTLPGTPVGGSTLLDAISMNDVYWRTDRATTDRSWNWQVARFDISATRDTATELSIRWEGHGEPTPGYSTRLYLWNRVTGSWTQVFSDQGLGADRLVVTKPITSVTDGFCLRCHDTGPPPGTVLPAGITNISATWTNAAPSDWHGPRVGDGVPQSVGGLAAEYSRGDAVSCAVCHDPHGTANPYAFPPRVAGATTLGLGGGNRVSDLCHACHTGATTDWHAGCISCHEGLVDDPDHSDPGVVFTDSADCRDCHRHGSETKWGTNGIQGAPGCTRGIAHSGGCHTWATTF